MKTRYFLLFSLISWATYSMEEKIISASGVLISPEVSTIISFLKHSLEKREKINVVATTIEEETTSFPECFSSHTGDSEKEIRVSRVSITKKNKDSIKFVILIKKSTQIVQAESYDSGSDD